MAADIRDNEGRVFARQGEVMIRCSMFLLTRRCISSMAMIRAGGLDETPDAAHTGEQNYPLQGSIPEMQKSLDSRVYFDQTVCSASASALIRSRHG